MLVQIRSMKMMEKAALSVSYKTVFCAGQTVHLIDKIESVEQIVVHFIHEYESSIQALPQIERGEHA